MKIKHKIRDFQAGDKVRIKSYIDILDTLDVTSRAYDGIFFNPSMKENTDSYDTIKDVTLYCNNKVYYLNGNNWTWSSKWIEHER